VNDLVIRPLRTTQEAEQCAAMMAATDPWITLGRGHAACLAILQNEDRERYVAVHDGMVTGVIVLNLAGPLAGYIQMVCVTAAARGQGVGRALVAFAEERVFREHPNVFLCVSSFNVAARRLYERLGYVVIGELTDFLVAGHAEILMRKTCGPIEGYLRS
jgi:ribosomal-protein-alanine N-acetyltransferase